MRKLLLADIAASWSRVPHLKDWRAPCTYNDVRQCVARLRRVNCFAFGVGASF